jgi:hypothetical protein
VTITIKLFIIIGFVYSVCYGQAFLEISSIFAAIHGTYLPVMLCVLCSIVMLSAIILNVNMLNVVEPFKVVFFS